MRFIFMLVGLSFLTAVAFAQEAAPQVQQPAPQPSYTDQLYLIGRSQEKQIQDLQQELTKTRAELEALKKSTGK